MRSLHGSAGIRPRACERGARDGQRLVRLAAVQVAPTRRVGLRAAGLPVACQRTSRGKREDRLLQFGVRVFRCSCPPMTSVGCSGRIAEAARFRICAARPAAHNPGRAASGLRKLPARPLIAGWMPAHQGRSLRPESFASRHCARQLYDENEFNASKARYKGWRQACCWCAIGRSMRWSKCNAIRELSRLRRALICASLTRERTLNRSKAYAPRP